MFNLKNEKLEVFKNFIIGKGFENIKFECSNFSIESFNNNNLVLNIDVTKSFGFFSTDEEYDYESNILSENIKYCDENNNTITKNIKSKLINRIFIESDNNKLNITFEVNVYSRDISYPKKREFNPFIHETIYPSEYVKVIYDIEKLSIQNDLLMISGETQYVLKSVDDNIGLSLFSQIDNLNSRIYLYLYIELLQLMKKNNMGSFNIEDILNTKFITSTMSIKDLFTYISDNKISCEKFKQILTKNSHKNLRLIPIISLYDLHLLIYRKGYYFCENSLYMKEFENILFLNEAQILYKYNLNDYKGYRRLIRKNLENIYHIKKLEEKGFRYKEVINILDNLNIHNARTDIIFDSKLLDLYISNNSKKDVVKKMFFNKNCSKVIEDTIKMLNKITSTSLDSLLRCNISNELINYDNIEKYFNFKLNINNLEREIIEIYNLIDEVGFNLYYIEKNDAKSEFFEYNLPNLDYNCSEYLIHKEGEYSLWIPLNSSILRKVGKELHICVGSYGDRIKQQKVVVLFVKKEDKYIGCIELDSRYETLKQAKIRYNKTFNKQEQDFIYSFCTKNEINIETNDMYEEYNTMSLKGIYKSFDNLENRAI